MVTLDFETHAIDRRPNYPPSPVGLAVKFEGEPGRYIALGSPQAGAATPPDHDAWGRAQELLNRVWASNEPLLFHNAKFDLEVAERWFGLPVPGWRRVHDTAFLAYLDDPHAPSLGLKELSARLLDWPPDERDAVGDWVMENPGRLKLIAPGNGPATRHKAGAWIWAAPAAVVAPYAIGDVERTEALFKMLKPLIDRDGMTEPYDRERELMPILLRNEQRGMRLDPSITAAIELYAPALDRAEEAVRRLLGVADLNLDADQQVAQALIRAGVVAESAFPRTDTGALAMSKEDLRPGMFSDPRIAQALGYRNRLSTCLNTFMRPWAAQASINGGYITTSWNQVRSPGGGTRTGRPSTSQHNFLNLPKSFDGKDDEYAHPVGLRVPGLPLCRRFILPDDDEVFLHRDYNGQELRVFGQAEQGQLHAQYLANPRIDPHAWVKEIMEKVAQRELDRRSVKVLNFQGIYGGGVPALRNKLRCTLDEAKALKAAHNAALPGRQLVVDVIKSVINSGEPIRTLGGRLFHAERPGPDGRAKLYKLINYWVQGGAADLTKQAIIDWHHDPRKQSCRFLVTVYDEINASAPPEDATEQMSVLRENMERPRFGMDVAMLSDAKRGLNWADLEKCE